MVRPVSCLYVMLLLRVQVKGCIRRLKADAHYPHRLHQHYGFIGHCHVHGDTRVVGWKSLSSASCT